MQNIQVGGCKLHGIKKLMDTIFVNEDLRNLYYFLRILYDDDFQSFEIVQNLVENQCNSIEELLRLIKNMNSWVLGKYQGLNLINKNLQFDQDLKFYINQIQWHDSMDQGQFYKYMQQAKCYIMELRKKQYEQVNNQQNNQKVVQIQFKQDLNLSIYRLESQQSNQLSHRNNNINYKNIIFIGQRDEGKSTLLNAFINYYFQIAWDQQSRLIVANQEPITEISSYYLEPYNQRPYGIHLMDTPGIYGQNDQQTINKVSNFIDQYKQQIDIIVICLKVTHQRLTVEAKQILSSITKILDKQHANKIIVARTFYSGGQVDISLLTNKDSPFYQTSQLLSNKWHLEFNGASLIKKTANQSATVYFQRSLENFQQIEQKLLNQNQVDNYNNYFGSQNQPKALISINQPLYQQQQAIQQYPQYQNYMQPQLIQNQIQFSQISNRQFSNNIQPPFNFMQPTPFNFMPPQPFNFTQPLPFNFLPPSTNFLPPPIPSFIQNLPGQQNLKPVCQPPFANNNQLQFFSHILQMPQKLDMDVFSTKADPAIRDQLQQLANKCTQIKHNQQQYNSFKFYKLPNDKDLQQDDINEQQTVVLIGDEGVGKSTMINFFCNYYLGVQYDDPFRFVIAESENDFQGQKVNRKTSKTMDYYLKGINGKPVLRIVDTPSFGEKEDDEQNDQIQELITDTLIDLNSITLICFVIKSSLNRLSISQINVMNHLLKQFGNNIVDNFMFLYTFADFEDPIALQALKYPGDKNHMKSPVADLISNTKKSVWLKFNNSAFQGFDKQEQLKLLWNEAYCQFKVFYQDKILKTQNLSLNKIDKKQIKNDIFRLRIQIEDQLNQIDKNQQTLEKKKVREYDENIQIDIDPGTYVSNCVKCNFTCHYPCSIPESEKKMNCTAMENGICKICPNKCSWEEHKSDNFRYESKKIIEEVQYNPKNASEDDKKLLENNRILKLKCKQLISELLILNKKLNYVSQQMAEPDYIDQMMNEIGQQGKEGAKKALQTIKDQWKQLQ